MDDARHIQLSICSECGSPTARPDDFDSLRYPEFVTDLLKSNNPPSPEQETSIRKAIQDAERHMKSLGQQIDKLQKALRQLGDQRQALDHFAGEHRRIMSPVRKIPSELVSEIAMFFVARETSGVPLDVRNGPWVFGQVSSQWRRVVLSLPSIWSNIVIRQEDITPRTHHVQWILRTVITRSEGSPLKLNVTLNPGASSTLSIIAQGLLDVLVSHSDRWRDVTFELTPFKSHLATLALTRGRLYLLEKFNLISDAIFFPMEVGDFLSDCPSLRSVNFRGVNLNELRLPWSQLQQFSSDHCVIASESLLLRQLASVTDYSSSTWLFPPTMGTDVVQIDSLRRVRWERDSEVLRFLVLPNLQELRLDQCDQTSSIIRLIQRSSCSLTVLSIRGFNPNNNVFSLAPLLSLTPTLTTLVLDCCVEIEDIISILTLLNNPASSILPKLLHISLSLAFGEDTDKFERLNAVDSTLNMIESRWNLPLTHVPTFSRLQSAHIRLNIAAEYKERVDELAKEGLKIKFERFQRVLR
ncbi:hypothetical protein C8J56DRAFT_386774 [Mycena floridula]|nr:hypothetical protein C8J56DRAFT_386774 [Mycena floridula]